MKRFLSSFVVILLASLLGAAPSANANPALSYQGRILKSNGEAFESATAQFRIEIRSPLPSDCRLYQETRPVNMANSNGFFKFQMNDGAVGVAILSGSLPLDQAFSNRKPITLPATNWCADNSGLYTPGPNDSRRLVVEFTDGSSAFEAMPAIAINYAPTAIESLQVGGFKAQNLLRVQDVAGVGGVPETINPLTRSEYDDLIDLLAGTSILYTKPNELAGQPLPVLGAGQDFYWNGTTWVAYTPVTGVEGFAQSPLPACASGHFLRNDGMGQFECVDPGTGSSISIVTGTGLTGGPITSTGTIELEAIHGAPSSAVKPSYDVYGRVTGSSSLAETDLPNITTAGKVSGDAVTSGTIAGSTAISTSGNITTTGEVYADSLSTTQLILRDTGVNTIVIEAPTLGGSYVLMMPDTNGDPGQILTTDGNGLLSWSNPATGSINSVGVSAPIVNSGTASDPVIGISDASTAAKGAVQLAADGGTTAGTVVQATDARLSDSRAPSGTATGDLKNSYPNPTVDKIEGIDVVVTAIASGQFVKYDGTNFINSAIAIGDVSGLTTALGDKLDASVIAACGADETLTFVSPSASWTCASIAIAHTQVSGLGTAAQVDTGTGAGDVPVLDGGGKLDIGVMPAGVLTSESDPSVAAHGKAAMPGTNCTAGEKLAWNGTTWSCVADQGIASESDPKIGTLTNTKWCTSDGTQVICNTDAPAGGVGDVLIGGNTVASAMSIGTDSNHDLVLETNNVARMTLNSSGANLSGSFSLDGLNAIRFPASDSTVGNSIAIGPNALVGQTTSAAYSSIAIGANALDAAMTTAAVKNIAIGPSALTSVTSGRTNIAIGFEAGRQLTTGEQSVFIGEGAGDTSNSLGVTSIGHASCNGGSCGWGTTAVGRSSSYRMTGQRNVAVGYGSLGNAGYTTANDTVVVGYDAGNDPTNFAFSNSVFIGYDADSTVTPTTKSIAIGDQVKVTGSNQLNIGNAIYGTNILPSSGTPSIGIGVASPARTLHVAGPMRITASTAPTSPALGDVYIDSGDSKLKYHNGTGWVDAGASAGGVTSVGATAPLVSSGGATPDISLNLGNGLTTLSSSLTMNLGNGLEFNSGAVRAKAGDSILIDGDGINVLTGTIAGAVMAANAVPNCAANQKLEMSLGPAYNWTCVADQGITSESDPQVGTLTNGKWCTTDGTTVNCTSDAPGGGGDVTIGGNTVGANMVIGTNSNHGLELETLGTTKVTVLPDGNMGVGTTNPWAPLTVERANPAYSVIGDFRTTAGHSMLRVFTSSFHGAMLLLAGSNNSNPWQMGTTAGDKKLHFAPDADAGDLVFSAKVTFDGTTGNVGIGTTSPWNDLMVYRANTSAVAAIVSDNTSSTAPRYPLVSVKNFAGAAAGTVGNPGIELVNLRGNSTTTETMLTNDSLGAISFNGSIDTVTGYRQGAEIRSVAASNFSGTSSAGHLLFSTTATGNTVVSERMRITHEGRVGIGTAVPSEKLEVSGNVRISGQVSTGSQTISSGATATIDWNNGNAISTNYDCSSDLVMHNLRDGGTYTLVITNSGTTQCDFDTATTGTDANTVSYRFKPTNAARSPTSHTIYSLMRVGNVVYVSWQSGF